MVREQVQTEQEATLGRRSKKRRNAENGGSIVLPWSVVFCLSPMPFGVLSPAIALPPPRGPRPSRSLRGDFEPSATGRKSSATKGRHAPGRAISARLGLSPFFVGQEVTSAGSWATFNRVTPGWTRELQPFLVGHGVTNALRFSLGRRMLSVECFGPLLL
jgi:hypothetical protein